VIVVAEQPLATLLADSGVQWRVQETQASVGEMWQALSGGLLDQHSRILVFSDSLMAGTDNDESEQAQTARAVVAMANAGARVFVALNRPAERARFQELIAAAAVTQGLIPSSLAYHFLPVDQGGLAVLEELRLILEEEVSFPDDYPASVGAFRPPAVPIGIGDWSSGGSVPEPMSALPAASPIEVLGVSGPLHAPAGRPGRPALPPLRQSIAEPVASSGYPASACMELLERPKVPGQVTITVTSSKGGSGKSTASILLAGSIARASRTAGHPLSVCLVDLDTRDGQVASLIGKFMPTALNIRVQPIWDEERIRRNLVRAEGLDVDTLLAPIRPRTADTVGPDFYRTIVRSLQRMYDVIIMDTSVQYLEPLIADVALGEADEILFVTTLASTAVQGMARALREITAPIDESGLGVPREKIGIIVNQSVANVGMERDQVLAAGLGVPVVGVIPLATKDVLTATNLNRMYALLDHPLIGPAYNELGRACLPGRELAPWRSPQASATGMSEPVPAAAAVGAVSADDDASSKRRGLFRR
jgi:cellulose biosynthesis protein BcsQ